MKKKQAGTFDELYIVDLDYQKEDGFWVVAHEEYILIPVRNRRHEKCGHDSAAEIAAGMFPNARIRSVTYC